MRINGNKQSATLNSADLRTAMRLLDLITNYLPSETGECQRKIRDAHEVIQGLVWLWTRESAAAERVANLDKAKRYHAKQKATQC